MGSGLIQRNYCNIPKIENSLSRSTKEWSKTQILSNYHFDNDNPLVLKKKIDAWLNITRIKSNFLPISILVGLSGYISDKTAIFSVQFVGAFSIVHMISAVSMVVNDLNDIDADCINHSERPLVQGTISETEATIFVVTMLMAIPAVGYSILPSYVAPIWLGAMALVLTYSPILKKMFFVKNMVCAVVVASTVPFVALSLANPLLNLHWIRLTTQTLFMASLYIELLLDITDIQGDSKNGVPTFPVIFGKDTTLLFATGIVSVGWINMLVDLYTSRVPVPVFAGITLAYSPFYLNLWRIWRTNGSKSMVDNAILQTTISLIVYFASIITL
jgi:4-hydroxybenzoate polyprenyltransferase